MGQAKSYAAWWPSRLDTYLAHSQAKRGLNRESLVTKHARSSVPFSESHAQTRSVPSSFMLTLPTCCPRVRLIQRFEFCHRKTETLRVQEQLTIFACASPPHAHPARVPLRFQKAKQKPARHSYRFTAPEPSRPSCPKSGYVPVNCAHPQLSPHASECPTCIQTGHSMRLLVYKSVRDLVHRLVRKFVGRECG